MSGNGGRLFFAALLVCAMIAVFWQSSRPAFACSCLAPKPADEALKESTAVFSGQVTEIKADKLSKVVSFDVGRAWKGIPQDKDSIVVITAADEDSCGYPFEESKEYLVYAYAGGNGDLNAGLCSRTAPIEQAKADLAVLGSGYAPSQPTQDQLEKCAELGIRPEKCSETAILQARSRDLPTGPEEAELKKRTLDMIMAIGIGLAAAGVAAGLLIARKRK